MTKAAAKHSIGGRVTDQQGAPQPGLVVRAFLRGADGPEHPVAGPATTDAQRRYIIELGDADLPKDPKRGKTEARVRVFADMQSQPNGDFLGQSEPTPFA